MDRHDEILKILDAEGKDREEVPRVIFKKTWRCDWDKKLAGLFRWMFRRKL